MSVLLAAATLVASQAQQLQLIDATIEALRPKIEAPKAVQFRRVQLRETTNNNILQLCGHVDFGDPRSEPGWVIFTGALVNGELQVFVGRRALVDAALVCRSEYGPFDRQDWSDRFMQKLSEK